MSALTESFPQSAEEMAQSIGLCYVSDEMAGFRRRRCGRGFAYYDPENVHVKDEAIRARFDALAIPPAWRDVWICADECGHLQVTGRDEAGRKQYIYHPDWEEARSRAKFRRMVDFAAALPAIRAQVDKDLRRRGLGREKLLAIVVYLLEETRIRIGNSQYARRNESYGLTTLENEHLEIAGSTITFSFVGKSGKKQQVDIQDRRLARYLKQCQEMPGQELFQYVEGEKCYRIDSGAVNDYLRSMTDQPFTAKDFRTWAGTVIAVDELYQQGPPEDDRDADKRIVTAVKAVADALGNTPQVCRAYYIHPAIFDAYRNGDLFTAVAAAAEAAEDDHNALGLDERAVLSIIESA